jgi:hypothetical protein
MGYRARRFDAAADKEALFALWRESLSDRGIASKLEARFQWLYGRTLAQHTFLAVDDASGAVVGCTSLLPHEVSVDGELVRTAIAVDLATAPGHRVAGPAVTMQRASVEALARGEVAGARFAFGYPNDGALPVVKRVGYKPVAHTAQAVKPARTGYKLRERVPAPFVAPLALVADRALAVFDHARLARTLFPHRFEAIATPDARFDALYERVRARVRVLGDRRGAFLAWRYGACPTRRYAIHGLTSRDGAHLHAYAIHTVDGATAIVVDALAESDAASAALFVHLASRLRAEGVDSLFLSYVGAPALAASLEAAGFFPRGEDRTFAAYVPSDAPSTLRDAVLTAAHWRIFDGELDI